MKFISFVASLVFVISSCSSAPHGRYLSQESGIQLHIFGENEELFSTILPAQDEESLIAFTRRATMASTQANIGTFGAESSERIESMFGLGEKTTSKKKYGWCFSWIQNEDDLAPSAIRLNPRSEGQLIWYYGWVQSRIVSDSTAKCEPVSPAVKSVLN